MMSRTAVVECPAKTNLTLGVGPARDEWGGRHELDTLYCGLTLFDTVSVTLAPKGTGIVLRLTGDHTGSLETAPVPGSEAFESNHAVRAARAVAVQWGIPADMAITVCKRIPVAGGLAGGSADAAGVLRALDALYGLGAWPTPAPHVSRTGVSRETAGRETPETPETDKSESSSARAELLDVAASLGADMPFCMESGLAWGSGFGERITPLTPDCSLWREWHSRLSHTVLGVYDDALSTPAVYRRFDEIGATPGDANHLQKAAVELHPRSGDAIGQAERLGAEAFVSGSGPTVVALCPDEEAARRVAHAWLDSHAVDRTARATGPVRLSVRLNG